MSKVTFDGNQKLIIVDSGVTLLDVKVDLYSDWKEWSQQEQNIKWLAAFRSVGGDAISDIRYLGSTYFLINGWKIRPPEEDISIEIVGNLYSDDGYSPFVPTLGTYNVLISTTTSNLVDSVGTSSELTLDNISLAVWNKLLDAIDKNIDSFGNKVLRNLPK